MCTPRLARLHCHWYWDFDCTVLIGEQATHRGGISANDGLKSTSPMHRGNLTGMIRRNVKVRSEDLLPSILVFVARKRLVSRRLPVRESRGPLLTAIPRRAKTEGPIPQPFTLTANRLVFCCCETLVRGEINGNREKTIMVG